MAPELSVSYEELQQSLPLRRQGKQSQPDSLKTCEI
jgi:hypothetical protein